MERSSTYEELKQRVEALQTELKSCRHAEGELRRSQEFVDRITSGMFESLVVVDRDFIIRDVNERFLENYGRTRDETIGRPCYEITHGTDHRCSGDSHPCPTGEVFKTGEPCRVEHLHRDRKGGELTVEIYAFPLFGQDGQVEHVVEVQHDVSGRKRAEQERLLREKLDGVLEMAGAVCHEFNQPLQVVTTYAERLREGLTEDSPLYEQIEKILTNVDRMANITRKLQNITSYETTDYVRGERIIDIDRSSNVK